MALLRHGFVSRDGRPAPEWLRVGGVADGIALADVGPDWARTHDLYWVHAAASDDRAAVLGALRVLAGRAPCVVLADIPDDGHALACLASGARGYCNSHAQSRVLKLVADVVLRGGLWVGESLLRRLMSGLGRAVPHAGPQRSPDPSLQALSRREREVAEAVANGASNKDVASRLGITERTVKAHLSTIFDKLGVKDRLQLAVKIIGLRK